MQLEYRVFITARANDIWPFLADPALMAWWNPKLTQIERDADGPVSIGETYAAAFDMGSGSRQASVEVVRANKPYALIQRYRMKFRPKTTMRIGGGPTRTISQGAERLRTVAVSYYLEELVGGTRVTQRIDLSKALPKPLLWLVRLICLFGSMPDKKYLQRLKEAVEQGEAHPAYIQVAAGNEDIAEAALPQVIAGEEPLTNMRWVNVVRDDDEMLEIRDTSRVIWTLVGIVFAAAGLGRGIYLLAIDWQGWQALLLQAGLVLAVGFFALVMSKRRSIYRFNKRDGVFIWRHEGLLHRWEVFHAHQEGQCGFDQIEAINIERNNSVKGSAAYYIEIRTNQGRVGMAYAGNSEQAHDEVIQLAERLRYLLALSPR